MKKQVKRFLCFFMCFCLCFAWLGPLQQVHAAGGSLVGVLLMFLVGAGIGVGINGTAHSLADGFEELVKSYETNVFDGNLDFWDVLALGSSIGTMGEVLLDKAATDLLNGFTNWLQSDKGWTEGSQHSFDSYTYYACPYTITCSDGSIISGEYYTGQRIFSFDELFVKNTDGSGPGTVFSPSSNRNVYFRVSNSSGSYIVRSYHKYKSMSGSEYQSANLNDCLLAAGYTLSDVIGYTVDFSMNDSSNIMLKCNALISDGSEVSITFISGAWTGQVVRYDSSGSVTVGELNLVDTSNWNDSYNFSLFTGHSGKIPTSVEEYNDLVLQDINSGVIPEVTTDVIVGTPDQVLPDEEDGTLAGTVSGILAQVKALPQTLANLVLDGVKSIFIPDPENMNSQFMALLDEINDKYSFDFDLDSLFSGEKEPDDITAVYSVGSLSWDLTFVSWFYLKKAVAHFRPFIRGFIVLMLIYFNLRQFLSIFGIGGIVASFGPGSDTLRDHFDLMKNDDSYWEMWRNKY